MKGRSLAKSLTILGLQLLLTQSLSIWFFVSKASTPSGTPHFALLGLVAPVYLAILPIDALRDKTYPGFGLGLLFNVAVLLMIARFIKNGRTIASSLLLFGFNFIGWMLMVGGT